MELSMGTLSIRWIGQNGYLLRDGNTEICIDPYLSNVVDRVAKRGRMVPPPFAPEELKSDATVCTHNHLDHVDIDAIPLMKKENMVFLAPTHARQTLMECGVINYIPFDEGSVHKVGDFKLSAVFADHSVPAIGVIVEHNGLMLYFSGDTEYHDRLCELANRKIDIMFICINGRLGNMNVDEAVKLTECIAPRVGIPTHYGMFESNTEDPQKYVSRVSCGFEMKYNTEYSVKEILAHV
jgi:L-ascorbate 6-phosphate lactonase